MRSSPRNWASDPSKRVGWAICPPPPPLTEPRIAGRGAATQHPFNSIYPSHTVVSPSEAPGLTKSPCRQTARRCGAYHKVFVQEAVTALERDVADGFSRIEARLARVETRIEDVAEAVENIATANRDLMEALAARFRISDAFDLPDAALRAELEKGRGIPRLPRHHRRNSTTASRTASPTSRARHRTPPRSSTSTRSRRSSPAWMRSKPRIAADNQADGARAKRPPAQRPRHRLHHPLRRRRQLRQHRPAGAGAKTGLLRGPPLPTRPALPRPRAGPRRPYDARRAKGRAPRH
jgi:hypothetical protein